MNQLAREVMRAEGRLGETEIAVGGERFAAGDQIITRINDHANHIYNRERWRITGVRAESGELVLDGIDTARRVSVDSVYLGRLRERDGGPAIEHAYAATTYQAQGSPRRSASARAIRPSAPNGTRRWEGSSATGCAIGCATRARRSGRRGRAPQRGRRGSGRIGGSRRRSEGLGWSRDARR